MSELTTEQKIEMLAQLLFPSEADVDKTLKLLGEQYGYGNIILRLKNTWSENLQANGMTREAADLGALHVCPWCSTDWRTGKVDAVN